MNDQHAHAGYTAYNGYQTGNFDADPLFGSLPDGSAVQVDQAGQMTHHQAGHSGQWDSGQWADGQGGQNGQWESGAYPQVTGYDTYGTQTYDTSGQWPTVDPSAPANGGYPQGATGEWGSGAWQQAVDPNAPGTTGQFDTTAFEGAAYGYDTPGATGPFDAGQAAHSAQAAQLGQLETAQFDAAQFATGQFETAHFDAAPFDGAAFGYDANAPWAGSPGDSGAYDATAWNGTNGVNGANGAAGTPGSAGSGHEETPYAYEAPGPEPERVHDTETGYDAEPGYDPDAGYDDAGYDTEHGYESVATEGPDRPAPGTGPGDEGEHHAGADDFAPFAAEFEDPAEPGSPDDVSDTSDAHHLAETMATPAVGITPRPVRRSGGGGSRGRRRTTAKRSALLTVAVPSACVMGVAGIAAASVGGLTGEEPKDDATTTASAEDTASAKPVAAAANNKLDTQLAALDADARDFGDRASRTQERIDLQARKEAERKRAAEEAARKEAARPKFVLPVSQHGLSAYYGQAGVNWMSMHTGIDFPVSYGTPVMAATDGTVRTQYNSAYGNMAIVTSPDGTETWYCHLSTTKIRSGTVKAGDVIAYSGNSGNSTGPHLHFEVRPGGGAAVDPLAWLRSHGLDPT
ncbi:M23 family metallopeptidase [Streptomyces sp. NPDC093085]|uniref:M23 family metallopeptidase n=1 Tax=Streptomyces sp. NPDC093085 TaxID=3155068 RepID=UPI003415470D